MTEAATAPDYEIAFDPDSRILSVTLRGFWTLGTMAAFTVKMTGAFAAARLRHRRILVLADLTAFPTQGKPVAAAFEALAGKASPASVERVAWVSSSALSRMQVARQATMEGARSFTSRDEAIRWLKEGEARS